MAEFQATKPDASSMSVKALKAELSSYSLSTESFLDKESLVDAVKRARDIDERPSAGVQEGGMQALGLTDKQPNNSIAAAAERSEDPLLNWTRPSREECHICMIPLPLDNAQTTFFHCCGKTICDGCIYHHIEVDKKEGRRTLDTCRSRICPFCRTDILTVDALGRNMNRANSGNHDAMWRIGVYYFHGQRGLQQDKAEGMEWWRRGAEAGSAEAACCLGIYYEEGDGVEQDIDRALEYYQKAVELGCIQAFAVIGEVLMQKGWIEEAMLNYRKAALCGVSSKAVFDALREGYKDGYITKDEYAFTLRENQKASAEMKSETREKAMKKTTEAFKKS